MWKISLALVLATTLAAGPALQPGEGLAISVGEGPIQAYGDATRETPMGSLAKLVWLQREGRSWAQRGATFRCSGHWRQWACWNQEGHGTVDLAGAAQTSCNLAFLCWSFDSLEERSRKQGESAVRSGLESDFAPFLGHRLPASERLPALSTEWIGTGALLRTTPEAFLRWLASPVRQDLRTQCAELLPDRSGWWVKTGTAAMPGTSQGTYGWVAGGNGSILAVLRVPGGRGKTEAIERFRTLLETPEP